MKIATTKSKLTPKPFQKLSRKSLEKGNVGGRSLKKGDKGDNPERDEHLSKYKFGEVLIAYDKNRNLKKRNTSDKPWYLYYPKTKWYTGGFETKKEATEWYENKGR